MYFGAAGTNYCAAVALDLELQNGFVPMRFFHSSRQLAGFHIGIAITTELVPALLQKALQSFHIRQGAARLPAEVLAKLSHSLLSTEGDRQQSLLKPDTLHNLCGPFKLTRTAVDDDGKATLLAALPAPDPVQRDRQTERVRNPHIGPVTSSLC